MAVSDALRERVARFIRKYEEILQSEREQDLAEAAEREEQQAGLPDSEGNGVDAPESSSPMANVRQSTSTETSAPSSSSGDAERAIRDSVRKLSKISIDVIMNSISKHIMLQFKEMRPKGKTWIGREAFEALLVRLAVLPPLSRLGVKDLKCLRGEFSVVERLWRHLREEVVNGDYRWDAVSQHSVHNFLMLVERYIIDESIRYQMKDLFLKDAISEESIELFALIKVVAEMKMVNHTCYSVHCHYYPMLKREISHMSENARFLLSQPNAIRDRIQKLRDGLEERLANVHGLTSPMDEEEGEEGEDGVDGEGGERGREGQAAKTPAAGTKAARAARAAKTTGGTRQRRTKKRGQPNAKAKLDEGKGKGKEKEKDTATFQAISYPNGYKRYLLGKNPLYKLDSRYTPKRQRFKSEVLFFLELTFEGQLASIPVRQGSDAQDVAVKIYDHLDLPSKAFPDLVALVEEKMKVHASTDNVEDVPSSLSGVIYSYAYNARDEGPPVKGLPLDIWRDLSKGERKREGQREWGRRSGASVWRSQRCRRGNEEEQGFKKRGRGCRKDGRLMF